MYDFKNLCLQSDNTLQRYLNNQQEQSKCISNERQLATPTKFDFGLQTDSHIANLNQEPSNSDHLILKNFLDASDDITRNYNPNSKDVEPHIENSISKVFLLSFSYIIYFEIQWSWRVS